MLVPNYHKGAINEVIVTDDVLTESETGFIRYYLNDKWKNPLRPPFAHLPPQILSTNLSGSLSGTTGTWYNGPILDHYYTWEISVDGQQKWKTRAAGSKLTLVPSDFQQYYGQYIRVGVKARNVAGASKTYSYSTTSQITTYPVSCLQITKTGTSVFGVSVLSSSVWSSFPEITSTSYAWQVSSLTSVGWETIPAASGAYFYLSAQHQSLTAFNVRGIELAKTTMGIVASAVSLSSLYYKFDTPLDLPALNLWLDASDSSTVVTKKLFEDSSWAFDGTNYVSGPTGFTFPSNNFTIEFWIRFTNVSGTQRIIGTYSDSYENNTSRGWSIWLQSGKINVGFAGSATHIAGSTSVSTNVWYHVAVTGTAGTPNQYKLYINGTQEGITYTGNRSSTGRSLRISSFTGYNYYMAGATSQYLFGLLSNVRIVDGVTVYPNSFDPNTSSKVPLTLLGNNTSLLAFQNETLVNIGNGGTLNPVGTFNIKPKELASAWIDKSVASISAVQTNEGNCPGYSFAEINGLNAINFGSSSNKNYFTLTSSLPTMADWTHFVAYRRPASNVVSVSLGTPSKKEATLAHQTDNLLYSGTKYTASSNLSTGVLIGSAKKNTKLTLNKIPQTSYGANWVSSGTTSASEVGRFYNGSSYLYHRDSLGEIIHTNVLLPDYEISLVDNYLFTKWKTLTQKPYCVLKPTFITSNSASLSVDKGSWGPEAFKYYYDWFTASSIAGPWTSLFLELTTTKFTVSPAQSGLYFYVSVSAENVLGISPSPSATDVLQLTSIVMVDPIASKTSLVGVSGIAGSLKSTLPLSTTNVWQICSSLIPNWTILTGANTSSYFLSAEYNTLIGSGLSGFNVRYSTIGVNGFSSLTASSLPLYIKQYETPSDFANLALWLDASDASTVLPTASPDNKIDAWLDKSLNRLSATQSTSNNKPYYSSTFTINDLRAISFDGANSFLSLNQPITKARGPHTHFFVYTRNGGISVSLGLSTGAAGSSREILYSHWSDNNVYFAAGNGYTTTPITSSGVLLGSTTSSAKLFLNKKQKTAVNGLWGTASTDTVDTVGKARSTQGYHKGLIGEIMHFSSDLPEFERLLIEDKLYDKWFVVKGIPVVVTSPVISENMLTSALSSTFGTWTASPTSYNLQWQVSNDNGVTWSDVPLATATSFAPLFDSVVENYRTKVIANNINGSSLPSYSNVITYASTMYEDKPTLTYSISSFSVPEEEINTMGVNFYSLSAEDLTSSRYTLSSFSAPESQINTMGVNFYSLSTEDNTFSVYQLSSFSSSESQIHEMGVNFYSLSAEDKVTASYSISSFSVPGIEFQSMFPIKAEARFVISRSTIYEVSANAESVLSASPADPITAWLWELSTTNTNGFSSIVSNSSTLYLSGFSSFIDASIQPVAVKLSVVYNGFTYRSNNVLVVDPYISIEKSVPNLVLRLDASDSNSVKTTQTNTVSSWISSTVLPISANQTLAASRPSLSSIGARNLSAVMFNGTNSVLTLSTPISVGGPFTSFFVYFRPKSDSKTVSLGNSYSSNTSPLLVWSDSKFYSGASMFAGNSDIGVFVAGLRKNSKLIVNGNPVSYLGSWGGTKHDTVNSLGQYNTSNFMDGGIFEYIQTSSLLPDGELDLVIQTLSAKWL